MQLSALSLAITRLGRVPAYSPLALFTGTATGAWYDPSDINLTWRRNLLTYTEQFDNAAWNKPATTIIANATVAPDGTTTADKAVPTAASASHQVYYSSATLSSAPATFSFYVQAAGYTNVQLSDASNGSFQATFDLSAVTSQGVTNCTTSITAVGNGWFRCSAALSSFVSASRPSINAYPVGATLNNFGATFTGDGTSGIYIWGAQLEQGSTATPYQRITDGIQDYLQYQAMPVMYQDAAGTTPVTVVEQPVGLMLDKSKGLVLGSELVTNGDFSQGATGWVTANGGAVVNSRCECTTASNFLSTTAAILTVGKWYSAEFDYFMTAGAKLRVATKDTVGPDAATIVATSQSLVTNAVTRLKIKFQAAVGGFFILQASDATFSGWVDNISVRELPGNHAFNASGNSANFPVLSARYNLKTNSEFVGGLFGTFGGPVSASTLVGYSGAVAFGYDGVNIGYCYGPTDPMNIGDTYIFSAVIKMDDGGSVTCGSGSTPNTDVCIVINNVQLTTSYYSTPVALGNGYYRISATYTATTTSGNTGILKGTAQSNRTFKVTAYDLRVANDTLNQPAYQRVNTSTDYDTVGFKPYLRFNGTNQWLQTNSIDFTYGDKMFVCAGVRKIGTSVSIPVELSANADTTAGTFNIGAPVAADLYYASLRGSSSLSAKQTPATFPSPITSVVQVSYALSQPSATDMSMRVNAVSQTLSVASASPGPAGAGNFGNYPLYIGARGGSSLWFNGRLYGMVVAGKQASADEIDKTEDYIALKTGFSYPSISGIPTFTAVV